MQLNGNKLVYFQVHRLQQSVRPLQLGFLPRHHLPQVGAASFFFSGQTSQPRVEASPDRQTLLRHLVKNPDSRNPPIQCDEEGCNFTTREARYIHFHKYYKHHIPLPDTIDLGKLCKGRATK